MARSSLKGGLGGFGFGWKLEGRKGKSCESKDWIDQRRMEQGGQRRRVTYRGLVPKRKHFHVRKRTASEHEKELWSDDPASLSLTLADTADAEELL